MPLPGEENLDPSLNAPLPEEPEEQGQGPSLSDRAQDARNQYERAKEKAGQAKNWWQRRVGGKSEGEKTAREGAENVGKKGLKEGVEKEGAAAAKRGAQEVGKTVLKKEATQVATKAGAQVAAKGVATVAGAALSAGTSFLIQAGVWLVTNKKARKVLMYVVIVIAALLILLAVIFALSALGVIGVKDTPTTAAQKYQADTLAGVFGDQAALRKTVITDSDALINQLNNTIKPRADKVYSGGKAGSAKAAVDAVVANLQIIKVQTDNASRDKLATTIMGEITDLRTNYPEMMGFGKNCADLAPFIQSGQLTISHPEDRSRIVNGQVINEGGQVIDVSPNICATILFLVNSGYKITVSTIAKGHPKYVASGQNSQADRTGVRAVSPHYYGRGMDITVVNGEHVSDGSSLAPTVMKLLYSNRQTLGVSQIFGPNYYLVTQASSPASKTLAGHHNHIHITVKGAQ
ncbi:MAG TPA: hypothetical protein VMQ44_03545 [Candidatus Saccharimonadales bacterium]|nr:hypothetical protein [Candidatus Saccharimonadales bacterium]